MDLESTPVVVLEIYPHRPIELLVIINYNSVQLERVLTPAAETGQMTHRSALR